MSDQARHGWVGFEGGEAGVAPATEADFASEFGLSAEEAEVHLAFIRGLKDKAGTPVPTWVDRLATEGLPETSDRSFAEVLRSELAPVSPAQMTADIARILTEAHSARAELVKTMRESGLGPIECRDLNLAAQRLETITMVAGSLRPVSSSKQSGTWAVATAAGRVVADRAGHMLKGVRPGHRRAAAARPR
jgi:hypothetical protein